MASPNPRTKKAADDKKRAEDMNFERDIADDGKVDRVRHTVMTYDPPNDPNGPYYYELNEPDIPGEDGAQSLDEYMGKRSVQTQVSGQAKDRAPMNEGKVHDIIDRLLRHR